MSEYEVVGKQLDSQVLYERQKQLRESGMILPGPTIVAAGLTTPENMGMVLRLADAAGVARVFFVNSETPNLARIRKTARNTDTFIDWQVIDSESFLRLVLTRELPSLVAVELTTRSTNLFDTPLPDECTLVIGSEQHGIPAPLLNVCQQAVHIPMFGVNGSINVTHALAIALFEWRRQQSRN